MPSRRRSAAIVKLLKHVIATDRYPLSPRVRTWKAALEARPGRGSGGRALAGARRLGKQHDLAAEAEAMERR